MGLSHSVTPGKTLGKSYVAVPLLKTKLHIPPLRPELVPRPRLVEQLNKGLHCKLTLIAAPAGFGKTTLLCEWAAEHLERGDLSVAWLSLDGGDNDPARFISYVIAALQQVHAGIGQDVLDAVQTALAPPLGAVRSEPRHAAWFEEPLVALVNEVDALSVPLVLVLEDYHAITEPAIHEAVTFLLSYLPSHVHVAISTRVVPPLSLSRLRGRGQLNELRTADVRFTLDEAAAYLRQEAGLSLSPQDVAALESRTEGWIVGLQMAALSLQHQDADGVGAFVDAFTGSHRYVLDYLTDEVLSQQPDHIQSFLLDTSILDRLSVPLCDAVLGQPEAPSHSQGILEYLERANLFVVPLDDRREWYRYHGLFGDLLRRRLRRTDPDRCPLLHRRASEWYQGQGMLTWAVRHAVASGDLERVAELVEDNAPTMVERGELATLAQWLDTFPVRKLRARPWLCIAYAWILAYAGQLSRAESMLEAAEATEVARDSSDSQGHIAAIRAYVAWMRGDAARAVEQARAALKTLSDDHLVARGLAAMALGTALLECGDLQGAERALAGVVDAAEAEGDTHVTLLAVSGLADVLVRQGRLRRAGALCRDALELGDDCAPRERASIPAAGNVYAMLSVVQCHRNDLETAVRLAQEGVRLGERWGQADTITFCSLQLARALAAAGEIERAATALDRARQVAEVVSPWFRSIVDMTETEILLRAGDIDHVARWATARGIHVDDELDFPSYGAHRLMAGLFIAQGRLADAERLLERLTAVSEETGATGLAIGTLVLHAVAVAGRGDIGRALESLGRALSLAEPEGFVRPFLDGGDPVRRLLATALDRGMATAYASTLLAAFEARPAPVDAGAPRPSSGGLQALVEPLSEREIEVLQLIAQGLTNREIGERLYIAPGTVKAHTASIYGKLEVHKRTQAVARARELRLL